MNHPHLVFRSIPMAVAPSKPAAARGPAATAGAGAGFEQHAFKAEFAEFVGGGHAAEARAED